MGIGCGEGVGCWRFVWVLEGGGDVWCMRLECL